MAYLREAYDAAVERVVGVAGLVLSIGVAKRDVISQNERTTTATIQSTHIPRTHLSKNANKTKPSPYLDQSVVDTLPRHAPAQGLHLLLRGQRRLLAGVELACVASLFGWWCMCV